MKSLNVVLFVFKYLFNYRRKIRGISSDSTNIGIMKSLYMFSVFNLSNESLCFFTICSFDYLFF